jgi:hypothetical protein
MESLPPVPSPLLSFPFAPCVRCDGCSEQKKQEHIFCQETNMSTLFAVLLLIACACDAMQYEWSVDAPTRIQWESNGGYCGELSLIEAGLLNGQYVTGWQSTVLRRLLVFLFACAIIAIFLCFLLLSPFALDRCTPAGGCRSLTCERLPTRAFHSMTKPRGCWWVRVGMCPTPILSPRQVRPTSTWPPTRFVTRWTILPINCI